MAFILVVDDEVEIQALLADTLRLEGHAVDTARDGEQALRLLARDRYDLIITDLWMPTLDGPALYQALRKRYGAAIPRVIFMTAYAEKTEFARFLAGRGDPVLIKPFRATQILQLVQQVLET
jgi:CheY-like chemotaxis protein